LRSALCIYSGTMPNTSGKKLRICHLADIHLGYRRFSRLNRAGFNQREVDVNAAFHEALQRVGTIKPDAVIIAGDLFHAVRPSNAVLAFCFRELRHLADRLQIPVIIIAGNHESPRRADSGSALKILAEIENVYVADGGAERFDFPDLSLSVMCLPHAGLRNLAEVELRGDERFRFNVLAVHAQVDQRWVSDYGGMALSLKDLAPHEWDYIALGHVHARMELALNAAYSGSVEHTSFDFWNEEDRQKGFLEIELPGAKTRFHALTSPREVMVLESINAAEMEPAELDRRISECLQAVPGGIEGKLVRLEVRNAPREVVRQLDYREIRRWRASALNLTLDFRAPEKGPEKAGRDISGGRRLEEELGEFCRDMEPGLFEGELIRTTIEGYLRRLEEDNEAAKS